MSAGWDDRKSWTEVAESIATDLQGESEARRKDAIEDLYRMAAEADGIEVRDKPEYRFADEIADIRGQGATDWEWYAGRDEDRP